MGLVWGMAFVGGVWLEGKCIKAHGETDECQKVRWCSVHFGGLIRPHVSLSQVHFFSVCVFVENCRGWAKMGSFHGHSEFATYLGSLVFFFFDLLELD